MFVVKDYTYSPPDLCYCRTIEKAKEIFERIFWNWVKRETSGNWPSEPADYDADTWEELLAICWEDDMSWDEVVRCEKIKFEEDKFGA